MKQYDVTGMSCAACSARVEKAVSQVPGVTSCSVSLLTNSMGVEGTASPEAIVKAVEEAGYGAAEKGAAKPSAAQAEEALQDHETPALKRRLLWSVGFLAVLMYFSMGHMMWGWPVPAFFAENHVAMGLLQLLLAAIVMVINQKFFISGYKSLWHRAPNMDTLVALGSTAAFVYSTYALFAMTGAQLRGDHEAVMAYDRTRGAFLPLAAMTIKNRLIDFRRRERRHAEVSSLDERRPSADEEDDRPLIESLASERDEIEEREMRRASRTEISEFSAKLEGFGVSLYDVAENCPRQQRTLEACRLALAYARRHADLLDRLERTGKLPITELSRGSGVERKTLERHRRYLVALLLAYTNGYEIIRGHLWKIVAPTGGDDR